MGVVIFAVLAALAFYWITKSEGARAAAASAAACVAINDEDPRREIDRLKAELMGHHAVLAGILCALKAAGNGNAALVVSALDFADLITEGLALQLGSSVSPERTLPAIQIVEQLRELALRS